MTKSTPFKKAVRCLLLTSCFLACCQLLASSIFGQTATATLSGTVEDQNGALIPNAAVTAINSGTALQRDTTTDDKGHYVFPFLPPGTYIVRVQAQGFATVENSNVVLNVGDQRALQIHLKAGNISEMVQITTEAPLIDTSPAVGTVIDRKFVENIPLNGRSFQSLISLTPGVVTVPESLTNTSGQFSINGQRSSANSFIVDGVSANLGAAPGASGGPYTTGNLPGLTTFGTTQSLVSVDALQEFRVQTSTYAAEYGRQPGGQISIVTRSGSNDFHGTLFDYVRNDVFDANDWFANRAGQPKPAMRQNDFGGTISGPVFLPRFGEGGPGWYNGRNRTFFFFSYEGLRLRLPQFSLTNVPTLCLRGLGACAAGQSAAAASVQSILKAFPLPNAKDLGNGLAEFSASYSDPSSLDATSIRIDHAVNKKITLFGRYNRAPSETSARRAGINLSVIRINELSTQTVTLGTTALISSHATNDLRVNFSSNDSKQKTLPDTFGGAIPFARNTLIPSQFDSDSANGTVSLNNFVGRTSSGNPSVALIDAVTDQRQFNIVDSFSYTSASHQLKFGFDYRRLTPLAEVNSYLLNAIFTSSQQVLVATPAAIIVSAALPRKPVIINFSAYAQDSWKLSRRLTLDLGVRWDVNPAPTEANGDDQPAVTQIDALPTMQLAPLGTKAWKTTYNNFAPRIGFAYLLSRDSGRETVIRGGFGIFYDTGNDFGAGNFPGFPFASSKTLSSVSFPLSPSQVTPDPFPIQTGLTPPYPFFTAFNPRLKLPYTLQWNLAVEQSLGVNQTLTVSYVGAAGRRLLQGTQLNLRTLNPRFTTINLTTNRATSDYNALQANFQRRLSKGLQALISYTWSHALDEDSTSFSSRAAQRGNAAFDVRHAAAAAVTYDMPSQAKGLMANAILGGWSVDTIVRAQSPLPVDIIARNVTNPVDGSLVAVRPNVITGIPFYLYGPQYPGGRIINNTVPSAAQITAAGCAPLGAATPAKGAFCTPPTGQSGNFGRNQVRGLPSWQIDFAIRREFKLSEKLRLQFRAEAFNVLNHPNFGTIQTSLTAANFGEATNMLNRQLGGISQLFQIGGPRSMQFAVKLLF